MKKTFLWFLIFALETLAIVAPSQAYAQVSTFNIASVLNPIIQGASTASAFTANGVTSVTSLSMEAAVVAGRNAIPLAASATAGITATRLAGIAATGLKVGSFVGLATIVVPWIAGKYGITVCPPPDFFCVPGTPIPPVDPMKDYIGGDGVTRFSSAVAAGNFTMLRSTVNNGCPGGNPYYCPVVATCTETPTSWSCVPVKPSSYTSFSGTKKDRVVPCNAPAVLEGGKCVDHVTVPNPVATSKEVVALAIGDSLSGNPSRQTDLYKNLRKEGVPIFNSSDPATVTINPVTTSPVVKTSTVTNPDGTTSTQTKTSVTTVTPKIEGSTVGDIKVTYPTATTTTTTVTNNVTNVTTTTNVTNLTEEAAPQVQPPVVPEYPPKPMPDGPPTTPETKPGEMPTDYNREVTQQTISATLSSWTKLFDGTGVPDASTVDQDADLNKINDQRDIGIGAITAMTPASVGFAPWFPQIATAACNNPLVPNPITGAMLPVEVCKPVGILSTFINGVLCLFCLIGCVREVQSALKA